jgi:hypothetical protein
MPELWTAIRDVLMPVLLSMAGVGYAPAEPVRHPTQVEAPTRIGTVAAIDLRIGAGDRITRIVITAEPNRAETKPAPARRLPQRPRLVLPALDAL